LEAKCSLRSSCSYVFARVAEAHRSVVVTGPAEEPQAAVTARHGAPTEHTVHTVIAHNPRTPGACRPAPVRDDVSRMVRQLLERRAADVLPAVRDAGSLCGSALKVRWSDGSPTPWVIAKGSGKRVVPPHPPRLVAWHCAAGVVAEVGPSSGEVGRRQELLELPLHQPQAPVGGAVRLARQSAAASAPRKVRPASRRSVAARAPATAPRWPRPDATPRTRRWPRGAHYHPARRASGRYAAAHRAAATASKLASRRAARPPPSPRVGPPALTSSMHAVLNAMHACSAVQKSCSSKYKIRLC
jgi:hypothetical protein